MPTYEYKCPAGHLFEKFFSKITDQRRAKCPTCGKQAARMISGGGGFVFKGTGFYATDYKKKSESKAEESKPAETPKKKPDTPSKD
jgi:putative FmdB family regulatory protein